MIPTRSRSPTRRKPCRVCSLPSSELQLLEAGLLLGWSARSLSARFGSVTRTDISSHQKNCVVSEGKEA
jgi:hypothetical protein